jgi:hypothetical protein
MVVGFGMERVQERPYVSSASFFFQLDLDFGTYLVVDLVYEFLLEVGRINFLFLVRTIVVVKNIKTS